LIYHLIVFNILIDRCSCTDLQSFACDYIHFSHIKDGLENELNIIKLDGTSKVSTHNLFDYSYQIIKKH